MIVVEVVQIENFVELLSIVFGLTHLHHHNVLKAQLHNDHHLLLLVVGDCFAE
jgi:hypothetical protein